MSSSDTEPAIDFAVAASREDGDWAVAVLPPAAAADLDVLVHALAQLPSEVGTVGLVSVDEDYFVLARVSGTHVRLMLSDAGAAADSALARAVIERLELFLPDDDEPAQPAGDMAILADLGVSAMDLAMICDDRESYPDELLGDIAERLGFGETFADILDTVLA
jgi:putative tRNA adenosine deaminase-associated protein